MPYNGFNFFLIWVQPKTCGKYIYIEKIGFISKHDDAFQYQKIITCEVLEK
jgi:hypothetical protein